MLQLSVPTLLLDQDKAQRNLKKMAKKVQDLGLDFRPHFKTHQSVEIGTWFADLGIQSIAVSSLKMAEKFARAGWRDIMVAIPFNINEVDRINQLAAGIKLGLVAECDIPIAMLSRELENPVDLFLEVDAGYNRTGIHWKDKDSFLRSLQRCEKNELLNFRGLICHAGNTYKVPGSSVQENQEHILRIHQESIDRLHEVKNYFDHWESDWIISYGDTPSCTLATDFGCATELRPGNFIFYDLMMYHMGVCKARDIAVALVCPVIGVNSQRKQIALHGGGVHFSKDFLQTETGPVYGQLAQGFSRGWGDPIAHAVLSSLSQEHGILQIDNPVAFRRIGVGDMLHLLPVHSCLAVDAMKEFTTLDGDVWSI